MCRLSSAHRISNSTALLFVRRFVRRRQRAANIRGIDLEIGGNLLALGNRRGQEGQLRVVGRNGKLPYPQWRGCDNDRPGRLRSLWFLFFFLYQELLLLLHQV